MKSIRSATEIPSRRYKPMISMLNNLKKCEEEFRQYRAIQSQVLAGLIAPAVRISFDEKEIKNPTVDHSISKHKHYITINL